MNDAIQNMLERRSIRAYLPQQIEDEKLKLLLECALYAPTGGNNQTVRYLVLQDPQTLLDLNEVVGRTLRTMELRHNWYANKSIERARKQPDYQFMFNAPTLITAVSLRTHVNSMADSANGLQNIQLAAASLGLGACWINQLRWLNDIIVVRKFLEPLGLTDQDDIFGSVAVGYPAVKAAKPAARKEGRIVLDRPRTL